MVRHKTGLYLQELTCVFPFHSALSPKGTPAHTDQKHTLAETAEDLHTVSECAWRTRFSSLKDWTKPGLGSRERQLGADKRSKCTCILEVMGNGQSKKGGGHWCKAQRGPPPPTASARRLSGLGRQMVALGTRSWDEVKRQNLTPRQNPVEISLEVGALENTTLLRGLIAVRRLSSNEGISNRKITYKKL